MMNDHADFLKGWHVFFRHASVISLAIVLLFCSYAAVAQATPHQDVKVISTAEKTMTLSELPDEFASCFQNIDDSSQFLLPYVRGSQWSETWQEQDAFLPVLLVDHAATLYFLEKDEDGIWHARRIKELFSSTDFSQDNNEKLIAIDTFGYWPESIVPYDGSTLKGSFHYSCMVAAGEITYVISVTYEKNEQTPSGWTWEGLAVLPISQADGFSAAVESNFFPGVCFDSWNVVRVGNNLQYQYNLNDQNNLVFDVETPYTEEDYDLLVMDERIWLGELQRFSAAKIDAD